MRLGLYGNYSEELAKSAQQYGYKSIELSAWPGSSLNAEQISDKRISEIRKDLDARDIEISALGYYPNYLFPDPKEQENSSRYFRKVLDLAVRMEVGVVCTFVGRDPFKSVADNIPLFKELFTRFCDEAEKRGVKIAIENCPMMNQVLMQSGNIAFSPEIWDAMFEAVPSKALGIELDPSHMVWLGIDYIQAIYDYGDRIFHIHAKDMEIRKDVRALTGIYGKCFDPPSGLSHGWWIPRLPGWGEIDWPKFFTALIEVGYSNNVDIEFEDDIMKKVGLLGVWNPASGVIETFGEDNIGLSLAIHSIARHVV